MDYSRPSGLPHRLHSGSSSTCVTAVVLRLASLLSALLALAAKENGIAALPIAISWDMIRLHQHQQSTWHHDDSGRTRSKTSSSKYNLSVIVLYATFRYAADILVWFSPSKVITVT